VISWCVRDEKGAVMKQHGIGALDGWSAAVPAFVAGSNNAGVA
jgi:hypothetical protein